MVFDMQMLIEHYIILISVLKLVQFDNKKILVEMFYHKYVSRQNDFFSLHEQIVCVISSIASE